MLYILHPRQSVIDNVDKMINCGDPAYGGDLYGCPESGTFKFVPFSVIWLLFGAEGLNTILKNLAGIFVLARKHTYPHSVDKKKADCGIIGTV